MADVDVARDIRAIEWLKAEIVAGAGDLMRAMSRGRQDAILSALAGIVLGSYVLGRRVGIPFGRLDEKVRSQARKNARDGHKVEEWYGDLSAFLEHWQRRRGADRS